MIEEPEVTLDDTTPRKPIQIDEPPISVDDTIFPGDASRQSALKCH